MPPRWTIKDILRVTAQYLQEKGIESPRLSAEILLAHQLKTDRVRLYINFDQPLDEAEVSGYRGLVRRRVNREPVQYITGVQEFWSLEFRVGPPVLIPRPESELLVEEALSLFRTGQMDKQPSPRILDLGTGCGALAVCLARELQAASVWASDVSAEALEVARYNASVHGVPDRVQFVRGDLLRPFRAENSAFDVILSNPPYISPEVLLTLSPEVREHEPRLALDGREGGMYYVREIIPAALKCLSPGGWLLMEMDPAQTLEALGWIKGTRGYERVRRVRDYSHRYRVVMARKR
jgi:release factor glutamine methyltransferase